MAGSKATRGRVAETMRSTNLILVPIQSTNSEAKALPMLECRDAIMMMMRGRSVPFCGI